MTRNKENEIASAIRDVFRQPFDHGNEPQTITEAVGYLRNGLNRIANAITADAMPGPDETGGQVSSLTEAIMGTTAGLCKIADAISDLAGAIREKS